MPVYLGLDLGEKRVGVARTDEEGTFAEAVTTLTYKSRESLAAQVGRYVHELRPARIVVGLPETLRDEIGPSAKRVLNLVDWLKTRISAEWVLWDERFTTAEAEQILLEADLSRKKRRRVLDSLAAQRILQSYLDAMKEKGH